MPKSLPSQFYPTEPSVAKSASTEQPVGLSWLPGTELGFILFSQGWWGGGSKLVKTTGPTGKWKGHETGQVTESLGSFNDTFLLRAGPGISWCVQYEQHV